MKYFKLLWSAILAGAVIGIGGVVFLAVDNKIAGAFLFSVGLLTVVTNGLAMYTGRVGYALTMPPSYIAGLCIIWAGNYIGASAVGIACRFTRCAKIEKAAELSAAKLGDSLISVFILALFCGVLMFIAVNGYKKLPDFGRYIMVILPVAVFILCGFEHCVANMFYFAHAGVFTLKSLLYLTVMTAGNSAGSLIAAAYEKHRDL